MPNGEWLICRLGPPRKDRAQPTNSPFGIRHYRSGIKLRFPAYEWVMHNG